MWSLEEALWKSFSTHPSKLEQTKIIMDMEKEQIPKVLFLKNYLRTGKWDKVYHCPQLLSAYQRR